MTPSMRPVELTSEPADIDLAPGTDPLAANMVKARPKSLTGQTKIANNQHEFRHELVGVDWTEQGFPKMKTQQELRDHLVVILK